MAFLCRLEPCELAQFFVSRPSRERDVPYHSLYDKGYKSIGCAPCTRPIAADEPSRAGRWWWESNAPKECGIHCAIESGGLEHELHALLGDKAHA